MQYLVTKAQMKAYDRATIEETGIPSLVLMERAACSTAEEIIRRFPEGSLPEKTVLVLAGCGNNGGDGFAIGRILQEHGCRVTYMLAGKREKCSPETAAQIRIAEHMGACVECALPQDRYDIIIDALLGIGTSGEVRESTRKLIDYINHGDAFVVSADIPSGIDADTGAVLGAAVRADLTVTYGYTKTGLVFYPGADYAGEVVCRKIGIFHTEEERPRVFAYDHSDLKRLPVRKNDGHKGSFGKVFVIAGSDRMYGACRFAVLGAYRAGAGLVRVLTSQENRGLLLQAVPEAIVDTYGTGLPADILRDGLAWADCVVIGPGIGTDKRACAVMEYVWEHAACPLVVDADGLNILAAHPDWMEIQAGRERTVYFTPHMGEFSRLTKKSIKCCMEQRISTASDYARAHRVVLVSKDARTVVADPEGAAYVNLSGDNGMATGGSGDVLAGILAGLTAQGMTGTEAACLAVYIHGLAGNMASAEKSAYAVIAGDLLQALPGLLRLIRTDKGGRDR